MKLVDQYLHLVGNRLPLKGKKDLLAELRTLILDDIEERFGEQPDEKDVLQALKEFGSPKEVAERYTGKKPVIAPAIEELFLLVLSVMAGGITVGLGVTFVVSLFGSPMPDSTAPSLLKDFLVKTVNAIISGTGVLTLAAIGFSRLPFARTLKAETDDWNPEELKAVEIGNPVPSRIECAVAAAAIVVLIIVANAMPGIVTLAEGMIGHTGIMLAHRVDIGRLIPYIRVSTLFWTLEAATLLILLVTQKRSRVDTVFGLAVRVAYPIIGLVMFLDLRLYHDYQGILGFRLLSLAGAVGGAVALVKYYREALWP